ncbi:hypothetical protein MMC25_006731 [Agyrium rufum]|nr:hypothetical protein [Agyrium rufum]
MSTPSTQDAPEKKKRKDHWTSSSYTSSASFVPALTTKIQAWLDPQPTDSILDLGCGDGVLTSKLASIAQRIDGLDASENLIAAARKSFPASNKLEWHVQDCRALEGSDFVKANRGTFDKVFSNAALHWILGSCEADMRVSVMRASHAVLKPGGRLVFEMGGAGNVAEVHAALIMATAHHTGLSISEARALSHWYFPNEKEMRGILEEVGFEVLRTELEYRPTELEEKRGREGGVEGWLRLMGAPWLEVVEREKGEEGRELVVKEICDSLGGICGREKTSREWLGYVRLRVEARKQ